jgi:hypothetical protein
MSQFVRVFWDAACLHFAPVGNTQATRQSPGGLSHRGTLLGLRKPPARRVVPKSFRYAWSRRSGLPPSDEGAAVESGWRADVGIGPYGEERSAYAVVGATCVSPVAHRLNCRGIGGARSAE